MTIIDKDCMSIKHRDKEQFSDMALDSQIHGSLRYVCVCVCERVRERARENETYN